MPTPSKETQQARIMAALRAISEIREIHPGITDNEIGKTLGITSVHIWKLVTERKLSPGFVGRGRGVV